ncbi:hypothetical protein OG215_41990 (plasmid) [Streptomyces globisporus]|uniref:RapZ C-terminal domain-containing protein n=1 Tax=Streptomyces globisporus TaxID=1908 RepID=UPI002F90AA2E|nr:hypothetical protein OG215_41990 [Streptomyces globisporus]
MTIRIISFGYGHGPAPATADLIYDVRAVLHDPYYDPGLKEFTGLDQRVYDHVMTTPGAHRLMVNATVTARALVEDTGRDVTIAWGCTGGRHRSVGLARASYELLRANGNAVTVEHRDVDQNLLPAGVHNRTRDTDPKESGDMLLVDMDGGRGGPLPDGTV